MVVDDYYKQGNAINQSIERDEEAVKLGLSAEVKVSGRGRRSARSRHELGTSLGLAACNRRVLLVHPTKANLDPHGRVASGDRRSKQWRAFTSVRSARPNTSPTNSRLQDFGNKWRLMSDRRGCRA